MLRKKNKGFTLIELIVVVFIMGILMMIIAGVFSAGRKDKIKPPTTEETMKKEIPKEKKEIYKPL